MDKINYKYIIKAVSLFLQIIKESKPSKGDDEWSKYSNTVRKKDIKDGTNALIKLTSDNNNLTEDENVFVHNAVLDRQVKDPKSKLDEGQIFDIVEEILKKK